MSAIQVAVCGALGKMGREVVKTVLADADLTLSGAVDSNAAHVQNPDAQPLFESLDTLLASVKPRVCVDFTHPASVFQNTMTLIEAGVHPVIGTTGLTSDQLQQIEAALLAQNLAGMVIPNFAIGAVLMMKFAKEAARYLDHAEIIEMHHNQKADAPSGTAIKTAELMRDSQARFGNTNAAEHETIAGARGATATADIHIHSIRLPGYVASQEVLLGSPGQILSIRHDTIDRTCFMPGVALCCKKVVTLPPGLVYGLEHIL